MASLIAVVLEGGAQRRPRGVFAARSAASGLHYARPRRRRVAFTVLSTPMLNPCDKVTMHELFMPRYVLLASLLALFVACEKAPSEPAHNTPPKTKPNAEPVVEVNGVLIDESDVALALTQAGQNPHDDPQAATEAPDRKIVIESLITEELSAQRAIALGLDSDETYRRELGRLQAQVSAYRRRMLADLLHQQMRKDTTVPEEEIRRYFDQHEQQLRTETHIVQILSRDRQKLEQAKRDLDGGVPFEEVAGRAFPQLPPNTPSPWDLGYLRWTQIPEAWKSSLETLKAGEVSDIIEGPRGRGWIIKVVDRRVSEKVTFETERPILEQRLNVEKAQDARTQLGEELRKDARIEYAKQTKP